MHYHRRVRLVLPCFLGVFGFYVLGLFAELRWAHADVRREPAVLEIKELSVTSFGLPRGVVEVVVTARDDIAIGAVEVYCGGTQTRIPGNRRTTLSAILRCSLPSQADRSSQVHAVVRSPDGTRSGTPVVRQLYNEAHATEDVPPGAQRIRQRPRDRDYPARVGAFDEWAAAFVPVITGGAPWWKRWHLSPARKPFDYQSLCTPGIGGVAANGLVLRCWLDLHPNIRKNIVWHHYDAGTYFLRNPAKPKVIQNKLLRYDEWTEEMKIRLDQAVYWAWAYLNGGAEFFSGEFLPDTMKNQVASIFSKDDDPQITVVSEADAWKLYLGTIAHNIALELGNFVPWSIVNYTDRDLQNLFHSDLLLYAGTIGYGGRTVYGYHPDRVLPAPPTRVFEFLVNHDIIRPSAFSTIGRFLDWGYAGTLFHVQLIAGLCDGLDMLCGEVQNGYRGVPPVIRLLEGTTYTDVTSPYLVHGPAGFVPACHGMAAFSQDVLRMLNIPVDGREGTSIDGAQHTRALGKTGHSTPFFWTIGHTLSHGDDVYAAWDDATPSYPASWLLLPLDTYEYWFLGDGMLGNSGYANVGRQKRIEVALKALTNELLQRYCIDEQNGSSHTDGTVAAYFRHEGAGVTFYDVAQLEAMNLWNKLAAKAANLGYCGG